MDLQLERPVAAEALARIAEESLRLMFTSNEERLGLLSLVGLKRVSFPLPPNTPQLEALLRFLEDTCLVCIAHHSLYSFDVANQTFRRHTPAIPIRLGGLTPSQHRRFIPSCFPFLGFKKVKQTLNFNFLSNKRLGTTSLTKSTPSSN
jgi:hypothetical protein